jgi:hypothetical protein
MVKIAGQVVRRIENSWGIVWGKGLFATVYIWNPKVRRLVFTATELKNIHGTYVPPSADLAVAAAGF